MGRKTWESIPQKFRPLADRLNIVLSRTLAPSGKENNSAASSIPEGVYVFASLNEALELLAEDEYKESIETVFVIGGAQVSRERVWASTRGKV